MADAAEGHGIRLDLVVRAGARRLVPLTEPSGFGAATFAQRDVVAALARGVLPRAQSVEDPFGHASGALSFKLTLAPGAARDVLLAVPVHEGGHMPQPATAAAASAEYEAHRAKSVAHCRAALDRVRFRVPADAEPLIRTLLRSNLAYILVNRDGPAIQPGSRAYARSWIRDGSLTSAALSAR